MSVVDAKPSLTSNKRRKKRSKHASDSSRPMENGEDLDCAKHSCLNSEVTLAQILNGNSKGCTPYLDGERCLLCHCERYGKCKNEGQKANCTSDTTLAQLPLWVCPSCRKSVEEEERRAALDHTQLARDLLCQPSLNLTLSPASKPTQQSCHCHHCNNKSSEKHSCMDLEKELQELQSCWMDVRHVVRCVYRETGTCLADGDEAIRNTLDENKVKPRVERLLLKDPHQLFERLEVQIQEYTKEVRQRLLKFLKSYPVSSQHAREFFTMLLDEYQALCTASDFLYPYFAKLELDHLKQFGLRWDLLNKHMFYTEVYRDSNIHSSIPTLITQLRLGAASSYHQDTFPNLLHRYLKFTDDMSVIDIMWEESKLVIQLYKQRQEKQKERNNVQRLEWENTKNQKQRSKSGDQDFLNRCHCGQCLNLGSLSSVLSSSLSASSSNTLTKGTKNSSHSAKCPMTNGNSQPWPPSSCTGVNNSFCPTHFPTGLLSCDEMNGISPSQLLPTALMMNNLNTCQCPACLNCRDMLCTDQLPLSPHTECQCDKCPYHNGKELDTGQKTSDKSCQTTSRIHFPTPQSTCSHSHHHHVGHSATGAHSNSPETAASLRNILSNGFLDQQVYNQHCHHGNSNKMDDWESDDDICNGSECSGDDNHGQMMSPHNSIYFPDDVNLEAPPGSPNSVRSHGDGSSCDTPPLGKSSSSTSTSASDDSRASGGKYCDCCYCEFFGHSAPPVAPTSHNYTEMRDKLRQRLTKRKPSDTPPAEKRNNLPVVDHRTVEELLTFIEGPVDRNEMDSQRSKAQKRARQKQKKAAEKARQDDPLDKGRESPGAESEEDIPSPNEQTTACGNARGCTEDNVKKAANTVQQKQQAKCTNTDANTNRPVSKTNTESQVQNQQKVNNSDVQPALKNNGRNRMNRARTCEVPQATSPLPQGSVEAPPKNRPASPTKPQKQNRPPSQTQQSSNTAKKQGPRSGTNQKTGSVNHTSKQQSSNGCGDSNKENGGHRREQQSAGKKLAPRNSQPDSDVEKKHQAPVPQQQLPSRPQRDGQAVGATQQSPAKKTKQGKKKKKASLDDVFLPRELEHGELDETERELEEFKRFCLGSTERREKIPVNVNLKGICIKRNGSS